MKRSLLAFLVLSIVCFMQVACGSTSTNTTRTAAGSSPQEVKITIGDFYVRSPVTTFTTGTQYQFVVTNVGTHHHDFLIMHPMETMTLTMDEVYKRALIYIYNIAPNETKTLNFTFDHTAPQGMLEFSCHYGGHYEAGMHQPIVVNAAPPGASVSPYPNDALPFSVTSRPGGMNMGLCDPALTAKIVNNAFTPASISLNRGDTLTIMDSGSDTYTLTTTPEAGISFTSVGPGETKYVVFPKAGTFILSSQEHPEAKTTVSVSTASGTTCGMTPVATVSFDANYADPKNRYFFTPTEVTINVGESITLSNLSDEDLTFTSKPDAHLSSIKITKNEHELLRFTDKGTYTISCMQFPNQQFVVTVQDTSGDGS